ncbi:MAG: hypothetical protein L6366_02855 [Candidatus Omnitrophica bacterium]|nr:hypothetical protein [Candidatus Omnitrophota bacterium]
MISRKRKLKNALSIAKGIAVEILYAFFLMLSCALISFSVSFFCAR